MPGLIISGMLHLQQKTHYHSGMQAYLVVRSFAEKEAYMYSSWYARVANKEYADDVSASQTEWERHFTVACYDDDPEVSSRQVTHPSLFVVDICKISEGPLDVSLFLFICTTCTACDSMLCL